MDEKIKKIFEENIDLTKKALSLNAENIKKLSEAIIKTLKKGGKVIIFGNGGSAADSQHFAAELVGRFGKERPPLSAVSLTANAPCLTAISNDYGYESVFSRQLEAIAKPGDVAIGISTSGNSKNVLEAIKKARKLGLVTAGLSGGGAGMLKPEVDILLDIPSKITPRIQENHILIIHILCELIEEGCFNK